MVWVGMLVSVACLGTFLWNADWRAIGEAFAAVDPVFVACGAAAMLMSLVGRAWRWRVLLGDDHPTSFRHRLTTTSIGFMGNSIFPGRIGEPLRAFMLARLESHVTFTGALATLVIERVFDLVATLVALVLFLALAPIPAAAVGGDHAQLLERITFFGWVFAGVLLGAVGGLVVVSWLPTPFVGSLLRRVLPSSIAEKVEHLVASFRGGLSSLRSGRAIVLALAYTAVVWTSILLTNYCMMHAFAFDGLGLAQALGLMVVLCFAVALPQAPGYLGVFQLASEATLTGLYDVPVARAKAFAIALWAAQQLPMIAAGALSLWIEGLSLREVRKATDDAS